MDHSPSNDALTVIKRILLKEWDPIGVSEVPEAQDEYDAYVGEVYQLLSRHAVASEVFDYLWRQETKYMGLRGDREKTERIAERLVSLSREKAPPGRT